MKFEIERRYQNPPMVLDTISLHENLCQEMINFLTHRKYHLYVDEKTNIVEIKWNNKMVPMSFRKRKLMIEFYDINDALEFKLRW